MSFVTMWNTFSFTIWTWPVWNVTLKSASGFLCWVRHRDTKFHARNCDQPNVRSLMWPCPYRCLWSTVHSLERSRYWSSWFKGIYQSNFTVFILCNVAKILHLTQTSLCTDWNSCSCFKFQVRKPAMRTENFRGFLRPSIKTVTLLFKVDKKHVFRQHFHSSPPITVTQPSDSITIK